MTNWFDVYFWVTFPEVFCLILYLVDYFVERRSNRRREYKQYRKEVDPWLDVETMSYREFVKRTGI